jgi:hypothetical protein
MDQVPSEARERVQNAFRGAIVGLAAAVLLLASLPAAVEAAYNGLCSDGTEKTMHAYVSVGGATFDATIGEADTRPLLPCSTPTSTKFSYPLVMAANIERAGTGKLVQIGYIRCHVGAACNSVIPDDGKVHFVYTPDDTSGGLLALADGWSNGAPTVGHRYRYKITSDSGSWTFCIKDVSISAPYYCKSKPQTWSEGTLVWWGTETQNTQAGMGPCSCGGGNDLNMYWLEYSNPANSGWWVAENLSMQHTQLPQPARYANWTYDQNYTKDAMNSDTTP